MAKKTYIAPVAAMLDLSSSLLSGSVIDEGNNNKNSELINESDDIGAKAGFWNIDEE